MDKRTILAVVLSGLVLVLWNMFFLPEQKPVTPAPKQTTEISETQTIQPTETVSVLRDTINSSREIPIVVRDKRTTREISNLRGVYFKSYVLHEHKGRHETAILSVVNEKRNNGFNAEFKLTTGEHIALRNLNFMPVDSSRLSYELTDSNPIASVTFAAQVAGRTIRKTLTFEQNVYDFKESYDFSDLKDLIAQDNITYSWKNGMPYTEEVLSDDEHMSLVVFEGESDLERFDTADEEHFVYSDSEYMKYVAVRTKYFMSTIMFQNHEVKTVRANQRVLGKKEDTNLRNYGYEFNTGSENNNFTFYIGPIDRFELSKERYDASGISNVFMNASGYESFFALFSIPAHLVLTMFNDWIGNFGLAILLFTIFLKLLLFPLTKKSYQGMKAMQEMKPRLDKLKEKYGDDPQKMQQQMMRIYKEEGINPLGGCLPMLLQMPLLMALYQVFRSAIELRGAEFLWISNFAAPDALPIGLDALGFATLNLLPILMAISQISMTKLQSPGGGATDPNQKIMMYMMPVMMLFFFYRMSAALNFYYLLFNVFTVAQQRFIHAPEKEATEKVVETPKGVKLNEKAQSADLKKRKQMYKKKED